MNKITKKEEEIMNIFWQKGDLFVKELQEFYDPPKPHLNTLSTIVRTLEEKGYLGHTAHGSSHRYHAIITAENYNRRTLDNVIVKYFNNSYKRVVSALIEEENISLEELKSLIQEVENKKKQ